MTIQQIALGREYAYDLINVICGEAADRIFAWTKLDHVRIYLRTSTFAEVEAYLAEENSDDIA